MSMKIETAYHGDSLVAKVHANTIETQNVGDFRQAIAPELERASNIVLDLGEIEFMDSTGLGAMLSCLRTIKAKGGSLRLASLTPEVRRLFDLVMMDRVFEIYEDVATATL
jgi:anti-sigma B factor antagonist